MKAFLSLILAIITTMASSAVFASTQITPLSQRSVFEIPNQTDFSSFGDLRNKRRMGMGASYQGVAKDLAIVTEIHLFEHHSVRLNINPSLDNLFLSAGLKSWINDEIFSPYWVLEAWNLKKRDDANTNGVSGSIGIQFNKIQDVTAGTSLFVEVMGLSDFNKFSFKSAASAGVVYNF